MSEVIAHPAGNLTAAVLLLAAAVLLGLMIIVIVMLVILPGKPKVHVRSGRARGPKVTVSAGQMDLEVVEVPSAPSERSVLDRVVSGRVGMWIIVALIVLAAGAAYVTTSQDSYCLSCHTQDVPIGGVALEGDDDAHSGVQCVACHEDGAAVLTNAVLRLSDLIAAAGVADSQYSAHIPTSRCIRCHEDGLGVRSVNQVTGVRMSHSEPLDAGWACTDCHTGGGHSPIVVRSAMSRCVLCHDATQASAECTICHTKDVSAASGLAADRIYGTATITRTDCEGCHSMESCDACHGIRMPHSEEFLRTHPRYSGFDLKEQCFEQCHTQADCGRCHGAWSSHPPSFKEEHKRYPRDSACNTCHGKHEGPICDLCHDFSQ